MAFTKTRIAGSMPVIVAASICAHVLGPAVYAMILAVSREKYPAGYCCEWKSNGLHPVLMSFAFAWLGPWGALSYKCYETLLGLSHRTAKAVHFALQTGAVVVSLVGVISKYQGIGDGQHFRSAHSWIGLAAVIFYCLQWVVGVVSFLLPVLSARKKQLMGKVHAFTGSVCVVMTLGSIILGILSSIKFGPYESGTDAADFELKKEQWDMLNATALLTVALGISLFVVLGSGTPRTTNADVPDVQQPLLGEGIAGRKTPKVIG